MTETRPPVYRTTGAVIHKVSHTDELRYATGPSVLNAPDRCYFISSLYFRTSVHSSLYEGFLHL